MTEIDNLLVLPRIRVQNANAVTGPFTWGFPAMSAFIGLMHALERRLPGDCDLEFHGVGVICHNYDPQVSGSRYSRRFNLTRNPVTKTGDTAAIVEEGRIHLEVTLVFAASGEACGAEEAQRAETAQVVAGLVAGMRIAGGRVMPAADVRPELIAFAQDAEARDRAFRKLKRRCLPGFALVSRDDLLAARLAEMQQTDPDVSVLDAWLDLSRLNHECTVPPEADANDDSREKAVWEIRRPPGWIVPIPVGYAALSPLYPAGEVANVRDAKTPFRFVESIYSIGEWVSPHRLAGARDLIWYVSNEPDSDRYRLRNDYSPQLDTA